MNTMTFGKPAESTHWDTGRAVSALKPPCATKGHVSTTFAGMTRSRAVFVEHHQFKERLS